MKQLSSIISWRSPLLWLESLFSLCLLVKPPLVSGLHPFPISKYAVGVVLPHHSSHLAGIFMIFTKGMLILAHAHTHLLSLLCHSCLSLPRLAPPLVILCAHVTFSNLFSVCPFWAWPTRKIHTVACALSHTHIAKSPCCVAFWAAGR